jgi:ADP-ribosylglycohydrolase
MLPSTPAERLARARISLEGLSVGDALGDRWYLTRSDVPSFIAIPHTDRILPARPWEFTDDTQMALSIVEVLRKSDRIDQEQLARSFAKHFEPKRGYGPAMYKLLPRLGSGENWQRDSQRLFAGEGSFGNGGSMRVAPLGAYFADDLIAVCENAHRSAEVTHAHPEGIAGAIAVAVASAIAWQNKDQKLTRQIFIDAILPMIPKSEVRQGVTKVQSLSDGISVYEAVANLGNGSGISAQDTVPFCLWCAGTHLDNYEDAIWLTISGSGDVDTNCAIVGGIVASYTGVEGIPAEWIKRREPLPNWAFQE